MTGRERLTLNTKTFAVPVVVQPGNSLTVGAGSALSQLKIFRTASVPKTSVPAQRCNTDVTAAIANGLTPEDKISSVTPPGPLGNLSINAYAAAGDSQLILHFCNAAMTIGNVPAGIYSFLAVH